MNGKPVLKSNITAVNDGSEDISIIVINYNNSHNLANCLSGLLCQKTKRALRSTIYVVDAGSSDNSIPIINRYRTNRHIIPILYRGGRVLSPAQARNLGLRIAKGRIVAFTDSDCVVSNDWLSKIYSDFENNRRVACVFGAHRPDDGMGAGAFYRRYYTILYSRKFRYTRNLYISQASIRKSHTPILLLAANNFAIRRTIWEKVGPMNTIFTQPAGEDILFQIRLLNKGYTLCYNPDISVQHNHPLSFIQLLKKSFAQGRSIYFIQRHARSYFPLKHMLELRYFFRNSVFVLLLTLTVLLLPLPYATRLFITMTIWLLIAVNRASELRTRLNLVLEQRPRSLHQASGAITSPALFLFDICDFSVKFARILSFIFTRVTHGQTHRKKQ